MATNFDATRLAVQTAFPTNDLLFDDKEMPSIHVFIPKFRLCDVLSTQSTETHPAFIVNGKEIDGFWVGKYQSTCTDTGRAYSLPAEDPTVSHPLDWFVTQTNAKDRVQVDCQRRGKVWQRSGRREESSRHCRAARVYPGLAGLGDQ